MVARSLLKYGADARAQDKDGSTPLHLTSKPGVARLLLEHGADATAQDKDGSTPSHVASDEGHEDVARLLLKQGSNRLSSMHISNPKEDIVGKHVDCHLAYN